MSDIFTSAFDMLEGTQRARISKVEIQEQDTRYEETILGSSAREMISNNDTIYDGRTNSALVLRLPLD